MSYRNPVPVKLNKFDPELVTFSKIVRKDTRKSIYLGYKKGSRSVPFVIETSKVRCPFGVSAYPPKADPVKIRDLKYKLSINLDEDNEELKLFKTKLDRVKERLIEHMLSFEGEDKKSIVKDLRLSKVKDNKEKMLEKLNENVRSLYTESNNEKYSDTLKLKVNYYDFSFDNTLTVYNSNNQVINDITYENIMEKISSGTHKVRFRFNPVYFIQGSAGVPLSLLQIKLEKNNSNTELGVFEDSDNEEEETVPQKEEETVESDNEESEDDDEALLSEDDE